ncbi:hypothetical protein IFM89_004898 [Coptis chinensis]|uniref:Germin-like protein n=1 Tax=Coptis chinensis TaxID=261450 RepID=A0A835LWX4_9MAGN|nr:hypothetical protein IFM89_004898 [Coptis chinensis]
MLIFIPPRLAVRVNGLVSKDPKLTQANDFFFSGARLPGNTTNSVGSKVTPANVAQVPGLNTFGTLYVRFVTSNPENLLISKTLQVGDMFVFPVGLIHFQCNVGNGTLIIVIARLKAVENPCTVIVVNAVFGSNPPIPSDILTKAFQLDKKVVKNL